MEYLVLVLGYLIWQSYVLWGYVWTLIRVNNLFSFFQIKRKINVKWKKIRKEKRKKKKKEKRTTTNG